MNVIEMEPNIYIMICQVPICELKKEGDYVKVILPWEKCTIEVSRPNSMENDMQFEVDGPATKNEFMIS